MNIDNHVHLFPDQAGPAGYSDVESHNQWLKRLIKPLWQWRMNTSHTDPKYIPEAGEEVEEVDFRVGKYGKWQWSKHGEVCWMQRGPVMLEVMEHGPEQMLAHMDSVGAPRSA